MESLGQGWFSEINDLWPGISLSLQVTKILHQEKSAYQDILVLETVLVLDGIIQCTERDEFSYQEMIAFLPLCSHPDPTNVSTVASLTACILLAYRRPWLMGHLNVITGQRYEKRKAAEAVLNISLVLIVGGGDGGVAREVVKHPGVQTITQVEIDASVLAVSKRYLPFMSVGLEHPKVTLKVDDGFEFMKQHSGQFDIIITDSSDPVGPAECLFHESYFSLMKTALKPGGIVCSQAGTVWANLDHVAQTLRHCRSAFPVASYGVATVPTYPTGQIGFVLGSLNLETNFKEPVKVFQERELDLMNMRYYNEQVHRASFVLPRFAEKVINVSQDH